MILIQAILNLRPNAKWRWEGNDYENIEWLDTVQSKPTKEELETESQNIINQIPFKKCKEKAKQLISATDWSVLTDVGLQNKSAFEAYRAELRALIITPVADPVWPTEPTVIWS
jgi:hypothetical protein